MMSFRIVPVVALSPADGEARRGYMCHKRASKGERSSHCGTVGQRCQRHGCAWRRGEGMRQHPQRPLEQQCVGRHQLEQRQGGLFSADCSPMSRSTRKATNWDHMPGENKARQPQSRCETRWRWWVSAFQNN